MVSYLTNTVFLLVFLSVSFLQKPPPHGGGFCQRVKKVLADFTVFCVVEGLRDTVCRFDPSVFVKYRPGYAEAGEKHHVKIGVSAVDAEVAVDRELIQGIFRILLFKEIRAGGLDVRDLDAVVKDPEARADAHVPKIEAEALGGKIFPVVHAVDGEG